MTKKIYLLFKNIMLRFDYKNNTYCFALDYHKSLISKNKIIQKGIPVKSDYINNIHSYIYYTEVHGNQTDKDILNLLIKNQHEISLITNIPTFSYIVNTNNSNSHLISIIEEDIDAIVNMISTYKDEKQINIILHSLGGYTDIAKKIVGTLYSKFEKVNFLIPSSAYSAAAMMCMSANQIIMTPESSLGAFDAYRPSPVTGDYLPVKILLKCAKEARRAHNPFCIFMPKSLYSDWSGENINTTLNECHDSLATITHYPMYWLMKYMFKKFTTKNYHLSKYVILPFWKRFSKNGRKANKIVKYFIDTGEYISHNAPIMYDDLKNSGLHISLAEGKLLELLRETSFLSKTLFEDTSICKLFVNSEKYHITHLKDDRSKNSHN